MFLPHLVMHAHTQTHAHTRKETFQKGWICLLLCGDGFLAPIIHMSRLMKLCIRYIIVSLYINETDVSDVGTPEFWGPGWGPHVPVCKIWYCPLELFNHVNSFFPVLSHLFLSFAISSNIPYKRMNAS